MPSDNDLLYLDKQLCFRLYTASRLLVRAYQPMLKALDITYPQYLVLMLLWEWRDKGRDHGSVNQLGQRLQLDSGTLTPLLKRLQAKGLINRRRSDEDERQLELGLTPQGIALRERALDWFKQSVAGRDDQLTEFSQLAKQLDKLLQNFGVDM
ncbi:MAG: MarR family transcriptional regulator [Cellvibrionaceae bacterium]|nr:MarR family transcriptional regulator [Cellvibrionaceae bacterium]